jgi:hypothetical protein
MFTERTGCAWLISVNNAAASSSPFRLYSSTMILSSVAAHAHTRTHTHQAGQLHHDVVLCGRTHTHTHTHSSGWTAPPRCCTLWPYTHTHAHTLFRLDSSTTMLYSVAAYAHTRTHTLQAGQLHHNVVLCGRTRTHTHTHSSGWTAPPRCCTLWPHTHTHAHTRGADRPGS